MDITITIKIDDREVVNVKEEIKEGKVACGNDAMSRSQYARIFGKEHPAWTDVEECNKLFLRTVEVYANDLLKHRGYLFLNDVYDMLNMPRSKEGQIVGWTFNKKNPLSDECVNFEVFDLINEKNEKYMLIDFNVDGNIMDYIQ